MKSVDDWKKRRREKQKMPASRLSQSGEDESTATSSTSRQASRTRRIHRFEDSPFYIQPLPLDGSGGGEQAAAANETTAAAVAEDSGATQPQATSSPSPNKPNTQQQGGNTKETSSNNKSLVVVEKDGGGEENNSNRPQQETTTLSSSSSPQPPSKCVFVEREVEISRPANYSLRGFGFLLNTGLGSNDFVNSELFLLVGNVDSSSFVERPFVYHNYAQIVVVEPGLFFCYIISFTI